MYIYILDFGYKDVRNNPTAFGRVICIYIYIYVHIYIYILDVGYKDVRNNPTEFGRVICIYQVCFSSLGHPSFSYILTCFLTPKRIPVE